MIPISESDSAAWHPIVRLDRGIELPEDPTLHRAAVWWEIYSRLPDEPTSQAWASYAADAWQDSIRRVEQLKRGARWIDRPSADLHEAATEAKARYDEVSSRAADSREMHRAHEAELMRALVRYVVTLQQKGVSMMVEHGVTSADHVRERLADARVAGYLQGLVSGWCGLEVHRDGRCGRELLEVFRTMFGDDVDDVAATIFFERFRDDDAYVDGALSAHADLVSFLRRARDGRATGRLWLLEYLVGQAR